MQATAEAKSATLKDMSSKIKVRKKIQMLKKRVVQSRNDNRRSNVMSKEKSNRQSPTIPESAMASSKTIIDMRKSSKSPVSTSEITRSPESSKKLDKIQKLKLLVDPLQKLNNQVCMRWVIFIAE